VTFGKQRMPFVSIRLEELPFSHHFHTVIVGDGPGNGGKGKEGPG